MVVSLLWVVVTPVYARGLALIGRALIPVLETAPDTRYVVEGGRLLAQRPTWFAKQKRTAPLVWPIWVPTANYGVPLLAALILATPGWSWRRLGRALAVGLGLLTLTQIAFVLVTIVATQQSPVMPRRHGPGPRLFGDQAVYLLRPLLLLRSDGARLLRAHHLPRAHRCRLEGAPGHSSGPARAPCESQ